MDVDLDGLGLAALVDYLDDLAGRRTPVGWTPDDAVKKSKVERRIVEMVREALGDDERGEATQLPCDVAARLRWSDDDAAATITSIGEGGAFLSTDADLPLTTHVHVQLKSGGTDARGLHVRGQIMWLAPGGLGVAFTEQPSEAHERRLHRFVMEILRSRQIE
jgi:hypothetical protein